MNKSGEAPDPEPLSIDGLLGELERAVMHLLWQRGPMRVREVHEAMEDRELAYTTVMTVMSRLADKGVLIRRKHWRAFEYRPAQPGWLGFVREQARTRVQALLDQFGDLAVAEFIDALGAKESDIDALAGLVDRLERVRE